MSVHYIIQKILNTNKCTKGFFITCNTLVHVLALLDHLQGEPSAVVALWLHFIVELLIVTQSTAEDVPAGSKHVGVCYK
jgi:hypothetical protein